MSKLISQTRREAPADAEIASQQLLLRGGFISRLGAGIYSLLPLGQRVSRKIEQILREEMDAIGGQDVLPSALGDGRSSSQNMLLASPLVRTVAAATPTFAATLAPAVAVVEAAAAETTAATSRSWGTLGRLVDAYGAPVEFFPVQCFHGCATRRSVAKRHKAEATRTASVTFQHDGYVGELTKALETTT
jgi:hypothetical protein